jgi:hypothetical protein
MYFGAKTVEFKIGSELDVLNRMLSVLCYFKSALKLKNLDWLLRPSKALIYAASLFGTSQGGMMVEVSSQNHPKSMWLSVFASVRGEVIPALLPSLATQMLLQGEIACRGIVPLPDWLPRERFFEELTKRGMKMASKTEGAWFELN